LHSGTLEKIQNHYIEGVGYVKFAGAITLMALLGSICLCAHAEWGNWERFGDTGISIRFSQVNATTCTWALRNDSGRTLKSFNFRINDINAESGRAESSTDLIPYPLRPGQAIGGWTAFSADAKCSEVSITSTGMEWQ